MRNYSCRRNRAKYVHFINNSYSSLKLSQDTVENNPHFELVESISFESKQMSYLVVVSETSLSLEFISFFLSDKKLSWLAWTFHLLLSVICFGVKLFLLILKSHESSWLQDAVGTHRSLADLQKIRQFCFKGVSTGTWKSHEYEMI